MEKQNNVSGKELQKYLQKERLSFEDAAKKIGGVSGYDVSLFIKGRKLGVKAYQKIKKFLGEQTTKTQS